MTNLFEDQNENTDQNSLFTESTSTPANDKNYFEELVGEGRKFKTPEDLARGKLEADNFIKRLQEENQKMREDLAGRASIDDVLKALKEDKAPSTPNTQNREEQATNTHKALSEEEILRLVEQRMQREAQAKQAQENLSYVKNELTKTLGDAAGRVLLQRCEELGLTKAEAEALAASKPKAFLKLVTDTAPSYTPSPHSTANIPSSNRPSNIRTFKDYEKLRKENKTEYWKPATQRQMYKDAEALGAKFYS